MRAKQTERRAICTAACIAGLLAARILAADPLGGAGEIRCTILDTHVRVEAAQQQAAA